MQQLLQPGVGHHQPAAVENVMTQQPVEEDAHALV